VTPDRPGEAPDLLVVVGSGPAGAAAARVLARAGADVVLLTAEPEPPYDRTHLSKQVLGPDGADPDPLWDATEDWRHRVDLRTGCRVEHLDTAARCVSAAGGERIRYSRLLLATGAAPRRLGLPGEDGPGVHHLRDLADARRLEAHLGTAHRLVIIGGGLIGLEVAAAAVSRGLDVHVLEAGPRVLGRGVPEAVATAVAARHTVAGVRISTGVLPAGIERGPDRGPAAVRLADGTLVPADAVVVGVGAVPRDDLAAAAGLTVDDGVVVDTSCRTSAENVWAAGDAVRMLAGHAAGHDAGSGGRGVRLETFTDAQRQGETAAAAMLGEPVRYADACYAWSDQYDLTVSSIGLAPPDIGAVALDLPDAVVVLAVDGPTLHAVTVAGAAAATGRLVALARHCVTRRAPVDVAEIRAAQDLAGLTRTLRAAVKALGP
jgi:3-phenylpropionate/trans-cinnamate dioxygenase ferredoxin reductase subunit